MLGPYKLRAATTRRIFASALALVGAAGPRYLFCQKSAMAASSQEAIQPSKRIRLTDEPCIVAMQRMLRGKASVVEGIMSLAQGIVHWAPPVAASEAASKAAGEPDTNSYCHDLSDAVLLGFPATCLSTLAKAQMMDCPGLKETSMSLSVILWDEKLRQENGLDGIEVMVTAGANQAYTNLVCTLLDSQDRCHLT
eukprot:s727_g17.t1